MHNKLYISGAVSNCENYINKFYEAEKNLSSTFNGHVFNPVRHVRETFRKPEELHWDFIMTVLLDELRHGNYTHIFMLNDWQNSSGAIIEHEWAKKLNMMVIYEVS